ncbi:MAG: ferritin-like domain-containing protein [Deltaproteobacteria bacterium]|nr:ferritin-like domain-containing protein [Deltaproteobacteria bacterium]
MAFTKDWSEWWRGFLDLAPDESATAVDLLRQRYVEEMERIDRFKQHAQKMHYPQYRGKLLEMAKEKRQHAERIGEKIVALGGKLPDVLERRSTDANSWQSLLVALEDENRSAGRLPEQLRRIGLEHPDIARLLQEISQEQNKSRDEIKDMLMRSDPFALSLA